MQILFQRTFCLFYLDESHLMKIILVCKKKAKSLYKSLKPEPHEQRFAFLGAEIRNPPPLKSP